jgi:hypothetical protein
MDERGVREARRQATLARDIVDHQNSRVRRTMELTKSHPFAVMAIAFVLGVALGAVINGSRGE